MTTADKLTYVAAGAIGTLVVLTAYIRLDPFGSAATFARVWFGII